jgi:hypothetical protein
MTNSTTRTLSESESFTIADAKYLASRIASDLDQVRLYYGGVSSEHIQNLVAEAAILLKFGLLESVKYGYKRNGSWAYFVSYSVNYLGQLVAADDHPGGIDTQANVVGATWYSYLGRRTNHDLTEDDITKINQLIPIQRSFGVEPSFTGGTHTTDRSYYRSGTGVSRGQYRSN